MLPNNVTNNSFKSLVDSIASAGVVGMGGAGFPTHLKLRPELDSIIVNGAECEPLIACDVHLLKQRMAEVLSGAERVALATGAGELVLAIKEKNRPLGRMALDLSLNVKLRVVYMTDVYPSGDEFFVVRDAAARVLPARTFPVSAGLLVSNVATFKAIDDAGQGRPLTHRLVSVCGAVKEPVTVEAPIGTSFRSLIRAAGGATISNYRLLAGGVMMGSLAQESDSVTKTSAAIIVLPEDNPAVLERLRPLSYSIRAAEHTCCQCLKCTELCSRYILGHNIEPHKLMRLIGSGGNYRGLSNEMMFNCTGCGLCSLIACPFDLSPRRLIVEGRQHCKRPEKPESGPGTPPDHGKLFEISTSRLVRHLRLEQYNVENKWGGRLEAREPLRILLRQHLGGPAVPIVRSGDLVVAGQMLAGAAENTMSVPIHAPCRGTVSAVDQDSVTLLPSNPEDPMVHEPGKPNKPRQRRKR